MFKLITKREEWIAPVQRVVSITEKRQTRPILSHLLLRSQDAKLEFVGSDGEMEIRSTMETGSSPLAEPVSLTVPARKFFDICKALPPETPIEVVDKAGIVGIVGGQSRFTVSSLPPQDFPLLPAQDWLGSIKVSSQDLCMMIKKTIFSVPQQDVRRYLNGLLLEIGPEHILALATDGHRLAMCKMKSVLAVAGTTQIIIPKKAVGELGRLLSEEAGEVTLNFNGTTVEAIGEHFQLTAKLINSKFPNYTRIIPAKGEMRVEVGVKAFGQALARVGILSGDSFNSVRLVLQPGRLILDTNNPEQEAATEELPVGYEGSELEMVFNLRYLLDIVNVMEEERTLALFSSADSNSLLLEEVGSSSECLYVLMPIRK